MVQKNWISLAYEYDAHQSTSFSFDCRCIWCSFHLCLRLWQIASSTLNWCIIEGRRFFPWVLHLLPWYYLLEVWNVLASVLYHSTCFLFSYPTCTRNIYRLCLPRRKLIIFRSTQMIHLCALYSIFSRTILIVKYLS